ncbi:MAG: Omp28-related outer membrane protein [Bacteroidota bacterium]
MKQLLFVTVLLLAAFTAHTQPNGKAVLVEKITSAGCPGCAWGGYMLDSLQDNFSNVYTVAIHRADNAHPDSMASADGDAILSEYLWAHPTAMVDRVLWSDFPRIPLTTSQWFAKVTQRFQDPVAATVGATTQYNAQTRSLSVTVNGFVLWDMGLDLRVNAYIVEDSVTGMGPGYDQLNGNNNSPTSPLFGLGNPIVGYVHRNVLRDMLGGPLGQDGVIPNPVTAGSSFSHTFTTTLDADWNADNIHVLVLVQKHNPDFEQRQIFNVNRVELNGSVLASTLEQNSQPLTRTFTLGPNPAGQTSRLLLPDYDEWRIDLIGTTGEVHRRYRVLGEELTIDRGNLSDGMYLLRIRRPQYRDKIMRIVFF